MSRSNLSPVIVFGGAGFIGTHLLRSLVESGRHQRIVSYDIGEPSIPVSGVEYIRGDVCEPIEIGGVVEDAEIYNLAAVHTTPGHEDWEYFWTNVHGATHVCDFAAAVGCRFLLFTSSISVYGATEAPVEENSKLTPDSSYGRSKLQAEEIHRVWVRSNADRRLVVVRPAVIFGPGEGGNFVRLANLLSRNRFVYPGRRDTIKSCGYVGELIRSMEFARKLGRQEFTYNLCYEPRITIEEICTTFSQVAGFNQPRITIPFKLMSIGGMAFEMLGSFGIRTSINRARLRKLVLSTNVLPKALIEAGYAYETDLREALSRWRHASNNSFV
ncbi:NAD-dependent epimerase/dehydratase family protein [Bradyrhizobium sp. LHD-71]|uniref:NAD-dependent epimerase/dehydratase family protein n=1 Tax=Bradyrhizobium sp. LHD-71 TaxID=3072141 RepID=UPI00280D607C|nr:NAD-dependent epimerase/dehydratase family protein [Bradyrhizobium sp. LHD-71]MDQ8727647.1 NAD-dependent epimerase/dehydratase family protein [Bradyrhizobium sp. LHD-71]